MLFGLLVRGSKDKQRSTIPQWGQFAWGSSGGTPLTQNVGVLTRIRAEDLPLMDASKWQVYICPQNGDDGIYDSCWSNSPLLATPFITGINGQKVIGTNLGAIPNSQFIPYYNRYLLLNSLSNTAGGSVVLNDCGPYPWGTLTSIGSVSWDSDTFPDYLVSFGQILPESFLLTGTSPLSGLLMLTTTGTVDSFNTTNYPAGNYSPFINKLGLVAKSVLPPVSQVSAITQPGKHILSGLDLFYDFRGTSSLVNSILQNLSPNDKTGSYNISNSGFSVPALFSAKGMFQFGFPPQYPQNATVTTPYNNTLTSFTTFIVFEHSSTTLTIPSNETVFNIGGTSVVLYRASSSSSWLVVVGSYGSNTIYLSVDSGSYGALVIRWDGINVQVFSSSQIPSIGYSLPLQPIASGTNSTSVSGSLVFGGGKNYFMGQ